MIKVYLLKKVFPLTEVFSSLYSCYSFLGHHPLQTLKRPANLNRRERRSQHHWLIITPKNLSKKRQYKKKTDLDHIEPARKTTSKLTK
jgi:hypothetical protein